MIHTFSEEGVLRNDSHLARRVWYTMIHTLSEEGVLRNDSYT